MANREAECEVHVPEPDEGARCEVDAANRGAEREVALWDPARSRDGDPLSA